MTFRLWRCFQSEIKSWEFIWWQQQVVEVGQWSFNETAKAQFRVQIRVGSTIDGFFSEKLWIPDFGESVFPFEHWNLRNRVRVILLRHQLPRKLKIENPKKNIYSQFSVSKKSKTYSFGVQSPRPFCPWVSSSKWDCQMVRPWIVLNIDLIWDQ